MEIDKREGIRRLGNSYTAYTSLPIELKNDLEIKVKYKEAIEKQLTKGEWGIISFTKQIDREYQKEIPEILLKIVEINPKTVLYMNSDVLKQNNHLQSSS